MIETVIRDEATPISGANEEQTTAARLHVARLVGSYHAYKGAGDPAMFAAWLASLAPDDLRFVQLYRAYGQPGRLDVAPATLGRIALSSAVGLALGNMPPAIQAHVAAAEAAAHAAAQLEVFDAATQATAQAAAQIEAMGQTFAGAMQELAAAFDRMGAGIMDSVGPGLVAGERMPLSG